MHNSLSLYTQSFQYDFAVSGGALGTIATGAGCISTGIALPKFSLITTAVLLVQDTLTSGTDTASIVLCNINNPISTIRTLAGAPIAAGGYDASASGGPRVPTSATNTELLIAITVEALLGGKFILMFSYYSPINSLT
jgi:hypothetical protein